MVRCLATSPQHAASLHAKSLNMNQRRAPARALRRTIQAGAALCLAAAGLHIAAARSSIWTAENSRHGIVNDNSHLTPLFVMCVKNQQERALLTRRSAEKSIFTAPSDHRGTSGRGKKNHFHLLDRYIRRIDALLPEDMEDLVRPLSYKPNQEKTSRTLKLVVDPDVDVKAVKEDDVRALFVPEDPVGVILGHQGPAGEAEIYVHFESNSECQAGRKRDGALLGGAPVTIRYSVDDKWRRVCEDAGVEVKPSAGTR